MDEIASPSAAGCSSRPSGLTARGWEPQPGDPVDHIAGDLIIVHLVIDRADRVVADEALDLRIVREWGNGRDELALVNELGACPCRDVKNTRELRDSSARPGSASGPVPRSSPSTRRSAPPAHREAEKTLALHPFGSGTEDHTMTGSPTRERHAASRELDSTRGLRHAPHRGRVASLDPPASLPVIIATSSSSRPARFSSAARPDSHASARLVAPSAQSARRVRSSCLGSPEARELHSAIQRALPMHAAALMRPRSSAWCP